MKIPSQPRNLKRVFKWLHAIGLSVYGPNMDPKTGQGFFGSRDYSAKDAARIARHVRKGTIKEPSYDED